MWGHQGSNSEKLVNTVSQGGKLGLGSYLVCRCIMVGRRTLLFLVEVKGHLGSPGSKSKNLVNTISRVRKVGLSPYLVCRCIMM